MKTIPVYLICFTLSISCFGQKKNSIAQSNVNGVNIAGDQNNYKIYYEINLVQGTISQLKNYKGVSKNPVIVGKLNRDILQLGNSNSVAQVILNQSLMIKLLTSIKNLNVIESQHVLRLTSSLKKINLFLEDNENNLTL